MSNLNGAASSGTGGFDLYWNATYQAMTGNSVTYNSNTPGSAFKIAILGYSGSTPGILASGCQGYAAVSVDSSGNAVNVTTNNTLSFGGTAGMSFYSDPQCSITATGNVTISNGQSSTMFYVKESSPGSYTMNVTASPSLMTPPGSLTFTSH
jgi:hypothetical protein